MHNVGYTCAGEGGSGGVCEAGGERPFRKWSYCAVGCLKGGCTGSRGGEGCPQVGHTTQGFNLHSEESGLSQGAEVLEVSEQAVQACGAWGRVQDRWLRSVPGRVPSWAPGNLFWWGPEDLGQGPERG